MSAPVSLPSSQLIMSAALVIDLPSVVSLHIAACFSPKQCIARWPEGFPFTAAPADVTLARERIASAGRIF